MRASVSDEELAQARLLFILGFFGLPWLWLINYIQFRRTVAKPQCPERLVFYVRWSLVGFVVAMALWATWLALYYTHLDSWGERLTV